MTRDEATRDEARRDEALEGRPNDRDLGDDAPTDSQAIREEIASTRLRMSDTLDEIGERLNPQTLRDNVKDSIKAATIGRVSDMARHASDSVQRSTNGIANGIAGAVRDNPIPAAMIAIGLGWMFFNGRSNEASRDVPQPTARAHDETADMAASLKEKSSDLAASVKDKTGELTDSVKRRAQSIATSVSETSRRGQGRVEEAFSANPLAMGAVAVAAGLAIGLSAPATDREIRLVGGEIPTFV